MPILTLLDYAYVQDHVQSYHGVYERAIRPWACATDNTVLTLTWAMRLGGFCRVPLIPQLEFLEFLSVCSVVLHDKKKKKKKTS